MSALSDSARLVDFVLWELRAGDLPVDVREAAYRLGRQRPKRPPHLAPGLIRRTEGSLIIDGMTNFDVDGVDRRKAFPHNAGRVIRDLIDRGCKYILVQDIAPPGGTT